MAAKRICPDCNKPTAGYHFWYKGGWRCKKSSKEGGDTTSAESKTSKPSGKEEPDLHGNVGDAKFPHMSDSDYEALDSKGQKEQDAKEAAWYKANGRRGPVDSVR